MMLYTTFISLTNYLNFCLILQVLYKIDSCTTILNNCNVVEWIELNISEGMRELDSAYYVQKGKPDLEALHQGTQSKVFEMYQQYLYTRKPIGF